jgi:hypothetical protein
MMAGMEPGDDSDSDDDFKFTVPVEGFEEDEGVQNT